MGVPGSPAPFPEITLALAMVAEAVLSGVEGGWKCDTRIGHRRS